MIEEAYFGYSWVVGRMKRVFVLVDLEPVTGIEPALSAWEADVLPLNYTGTLGVRATVADGERGLVGVLGGGGGLGGGG